eukprot:TRINITY_DN37553_c0_g1_i2.p1 TRINITY_DN37553_c0_g1~~TRINITY_DN37553_c0_g1_i2.p1  ORF type:complete len:122 (-),score=24.22 TRINITY_DN37553_c0_g1_i2:59-400(-)
MGEPRWALSEANVSQEVWHHLCQHVLQQRRRNNPHKFSAEAVDAAVNSLIQQCASEGIVLPLVRVSDFVYALHGRVPKKLRLNVRSGKLVVRLGGGYCDILEYLDRIAAQNEI